MYFIVQNVYANGINIMEIEKQILFNVVKNFGDCKSTRIIFNFLSSGSEDLLLPVKIKGHV